MGYYSKFSLTISGANNQPDHTLESSEIMEDLRDSVDEARYALAKNGDSSGEETKWHDAEKELRDFSKKYPTALFKLEVEGEETGDLWHLYVLNGKAQKCKAQIVYPEYDSAKLA